MTGVEASEIRLGVAVFGRLSGFPWWPAVVSKCEPSGEWTKDGKFWVVFFNDRNGAWLKSSEIRAFDAYNKDRCIEHNSTTPKFRRYQERVQKACLMAEKYIFSPKRIRVRVVGPRRTDGTPVGEEAEVISISDAIPDEDGSGASSEPVEPPKKNRGRSAKSGTKRSRAQARARGKLDEDQASDDENVRSGEKGRDRDGRSKRKRVRSSRYEEFMGPFEDRNIQKRKKPPVSENGRGSSEDAELNPLHYSPPKGLRTDDGKKITSKKPKAPSDGSDDVRKRLNPRPSRRASRNASQALAEEAKERRKASKRIDRPLPSKKAISKRLAHEPMRPTSNTDEDKRADAAVTREMYISELTNMVSPRLRHRQRGQQINDLISLRRSVRSRAGSSSLENTSNSEETDSEEEPERVRKVVNGSLEAAAEDLVEYAVRAEKGRSGGSRVDVLDMDTFPLGGSELVCSILNRVSDLERDVALLRKQSTLEEQATLGEDATAAGLKSAVEALASATAAFAKARDYDTPMISRSLDLLWSDGHFPLEGADGELLRTVARSLVLASCKRRYAQLSREKIVKKRPHSAVERKMAPQFIRQKADLRELRANSEESAGNMDRETGEKQVPDNNAARNQGQGPSSERNGRTLPQVKQEDSLLSSETRDQRVNVAHQAGTRVRKDTSGRLENKSWNDQAAQIDSEEVIDGDMEQTLGEVRSRA